jgi:tetratricopeptide (TPR) repeat protein
MLMKMKDEKEAMALWEKSVKVFEDAGEIKLAGKMWLDNGMKYEKMRDVEGAKTAFEKSIELLQKAYGEEHEVTKIAKEKMEKLLKTDLKE